MRQEGVLGALLTDGRATTEALAGFVLTALLTALRMCLLADAPPYVNNPMMNSNPVFLAWTLVVFALFNSLFVGPFYKTAYKFGRPFVTFIVASMLAIGCAETLHHIPTLTFLNTNERLPLQFLLLLCALAVWAAATLLSCRRAEKNFERLDL